MAHKHILILLIHSIHAYSFLPFYSLDYFQQFLYPISYFILYFKFLIANITSLYFTRIELSIKTTSRSSGTLKPQIQLCLSPRIFFLQATRSAGRGDSTSRAENWRENVSPHEQTPKHSKKPVVTVSDHSVPRNPRQGNQIKPHSTQTRPTQRRPRIHGRGCGADPARQLPQARGHSAG